jgi:hypothetical protein
MDEELLAGPEKNRADSRPPETGRACEHEVVIAR